MPVKLLQKILRTLKTWIGKERKDDVSDFSVKSESDSL